MNSSGIKRGLAASAIGALAVAGLPLLATSASAVPLSAQTPQVTLLTQGYYVDTTGADDPNTEDDTGRYENTETFDFDGTNRTASVVATGPANVTSIQFQYRTATSGAGSTWVNIGDVQARNADGVFAVEWARPADVTNGASVQLRAVPNTGLEDAVVGDVVITTGQPAVELGTEGSTGIYRNPAPANYGGAARYFVGVRGTTSPNPSLTDVVVFDAVQDAAGGGTGGTTSAWNNGAGVTGNPVATAPAADAPEGSPWTFEGVLVYEAYNFSADTSANQAALTAAIDNDEDTEGVSYYVQNIASVTAAPRQTSVNAGGSTSATVTVLDQQGKPVAGASVRYTSDANPSDTTPATEGSTEILTDANGRATFTGLTAGANGTAYNFYADVDGTNTRTASDVAAASFTLTEYNAQFAAVSVAANPNRTAYDFDELDQTTFTVTTRDQNGNPINGQPIQYRWVVDPTAAGAPNAATAFTDATATSGEGTTTVTFPTTGGFTYVDATGVTRTIADNDLPAGAYSLEVRRPNVNGTGLTNATPITFEAGESEITFEEGASANAPVNGTFTVRGNLALVGSGTDLANRLVTITQSGTGDSFVVGTADQPAGTTQTSQTTATARTDANGNFAVTLRDPAIPANVTPTPEVDQINAVATALVGNIGADDTLTVNDAQDAEGDLTVNFIVAPTVKRIVVDEDELFAGNAAPGKPVDLDIEVYAEGPTAAASDDVLLQDFPVTVSVDKGFLSPNAETVGDLSLSAENDDEGDLFGFYENLGKQQTISTGDNREAGIVAAIERDEDFDDDGLADVKVTITAGGVTENVDITFDSRNFLNLADLRLERAAGEPSGDVTVGSEVDFNLYAKDQFGNLVGDTAARITDDSTVADVRTDGDFGVTLTDFTTSGAGITATSAAPAVQVLTATITGADENLVDENGNLDADDRTVTAQSAPITWVEGTTPPPPAAIKPGIQAFNVTRQQPGMDWIKVGAAKAKGAKVKLFQVTKNGRKLVRTGNISDKGQKIWILPDGAVNKERTFYAVVVATDTNQRGVTKRVTIK